MNKKLLRYPSAKRASEKKVFTLRNILKKKIFIDSIFHLCSTVILLVQTFHAHVFGLFPLSNFNLLVFFLSQFKYLDKDEFKDLKYLRRLHLDGNQLSVIVDYLFQRQKNLVFLGECSRDERMKLNRAYKLRNNFQFSTDISRNRLAKISGRAFNNLLNLTFLDISYNKLSALEWDYMCHMPKLQTLNISGNVQLNLLEIRPVFQNLTELRALSIADIANMPLGIFVPLGNLLMLNISGTHLNNETLQILNPLAKLKVSHAHDVPEVDLAFICSPIFYLASFIFVKTI